MSRKLYLDLMLRDEHGTVHGRVRREITDEAAFNGQRAAEDAKFPFPVAGATPFEQTVKVLQVREFRRGLLKEAAAMIGGQLADFLEDREGWHGLDRQERVEKIARES